MIVLDASVALAWCFEDELSAAADVVADRLMSEPAIVPAIWPLEVANAVVAAERRGRLTERDAAEILELLTVLPIEIEATSTRQALGAIAAVAREHGLSAYDAAYLELAARLQAPLATLEKRLLAAARSAGIELLIDAG